MKELGINIIHCLYCKKVFNKKGFHSFYWNDPSPVCLKCEGNGFELNHIINNRDIAWMLDRIDRYKKSGTISELKQKTCICPPCVMLREILEAEDE